MPRVPRPYYLPLLLTSYPYLPLPISPLLIPLTHLPHTLALSVSPLTRLPHTPACLIPLTQ